MYRSTIVLLLLMFTVTINGQKADSWRRKKLIVEKCPPMPIMRNAVKEKLLGFWYAYATTPLPFPRYQRECASYNVKNSPYFKTNILYTNYNGLVITYACTPNPHDRMFTMKLRILTHTRTPMPEIINEAITLLKSVRFPVSTLEWLRAEAFCFEWYQLKFETHPRPIRFQAPFNQPDE